MSEIKLNLIDSQRILHGTIHGSIGDRAVAALTAEPETIAELELALERYEKPSADEGFFSSFSKCESIDEELWDAGLMIIDLPARLVAVVSSYSRPSEEGEVEFHDGESTTGVRVPYRVSSDWRFLYSIEEYNYLRNERAATRTPTLALDARIVLYGRELLEFIAQETMKLMRSDGSQSICETMLANPRIEESANRSSSEADASDFNADRFINENLERENWPSQIHAQWLSTPREELHNQSPRELMLTKQDFIDFDLHTRELQWSFLHEGPPCLPLDSRAYRCAAFGTHEWVIYYDLVRYLICSAFALHSSFAGEELIVKLEEVMTKWLETPNDDYDKRTPANLLESERKRLPIAMSPKEMVVSDDCPICRMMAEDMELMHEVGFWHLDASHIEDDFVFSTFMRHAEWEADRLRWQEFNENFAREQAERASREAERTAREKRQFLTADASG
jgi:hypothetical protein